MRQQCRFCVHAKDMLKINYICSAVASCGGYGGGRIYSATRARKDNHCRNYQYSGVDIFTGKPPLDETMEKEIEIARIKKQLTLL